MIKWLTYGLCLAISTSVQAFPCYLTIAKDSCWTQFNVTIKTMDADTNEVLTTLSIPAGSQWVRKKMECRVNQKLQFIAAFNPSIWDKDEGKLFKSKNFLFLPSAIKPKEVAWDLRLCYPAEFAEVPLPADAGNRCVCDFEKIPAIVPQLKAVQ